MFEKVLQLSQQFYRSFTTLISLYGVFYVFAIQENIWPQFTNPSCWEKDSSPSQLKFLLEGIFQNVKSLYPDAKMSK